MREQRRELGICLNGSVSCDGGQLRASVDQASVVEPWRVQVFHRIPLLADREYTLCFDARADQARSISIYLDEGPSNYRLLTGRLAKDRVDIGSTWGTYEMTWQPTETDITSRVAFDCRVVFLDNTVSTRAANARSRSSTASLIDHFGPILTWR